MWYNRKTKQIKLWSVILCRKNGMCTGKNKKQKSKKQEVKDNTGLQF